MVVSEGIEGDRNQTIKERYRPVIFLQDFTSDSLVWGLKNPSGNLLKTIAMLISKNPHVHTNLKLVTSEKYKDISNSTKREERK